MFYLFIYFILFLQQLLHRVLVAEINALQGMAAIGQRPLLMEVGVSCIVRFLLYY